jgi:hypothetical protein
MVEQGHLEHVPPPPAPAEPTLGALLVRLSQRATDTQAVIACGAGTLLAAAVLIFATSWWRVSLAGVSLAAFGAWIILERGASAGAWRPLVQRLAVILGAASVFVLGLSLLTRALGTWIS